MPSELKSRIPPSVVKRLTKYMAHVQHRQNEGVKWVSSVELAETLGLTSSTVRQDLSHVDFFGVSRRGYEAEGLRRVLAGVLGADKEWRMVVVGAGHLGQALVLHEEFDRRGMNILGIFDKDPKKVGSRVGKLTVGGMSGLPAFVRQNAVDIGIIAVPAEAAHRVADLLIASGIHGLLNLSLTHIVTPRHIPVVDSRIIASLMQLTHAIQQHAAPADAKR